MNEVVSNMMTSNKKLKGLLLAAALFGAPAVQAARVMITDDPQAPKEVDYNIRLGPLSLALTGFMQVRYDDNIQRTVRRGQYDSGWSFTPGLSSNIAIDVPFTPYVTVDADVKMSYRHFPDDEGNDGFQFSGADGSLGARISADIMLGQRGTLTLTESINRTSESLDVLRFGEPADYALTDNTVSATYAVELDPYWHLTVLAAHTNVWANESAWDYQNHRREQFESRLLWAMNREWRIGPYMRWTTTVYEEKLHNDSVSTEIGATAIYKVSDSLSLSGSLGLERLSFDTTNNPAARDRVKSGPTADFSVDFTADNPQRFYMNYGRSQRTLGPTVNYSDDLTLGYSILFKITEHISLTTGVDYIHVRESDGGESGNLMRFNIGGGWALNRKTSVDLRYGHTKKWSDDSLREYRQNIYELTLSHKF